MSAVTFREASSADWRLVAALLVEAKLPDLGARDHLSNFVLAFEGTELVGCAGLERYGRYALLRSVAVAARKRGEGLGDALVRRVLLRAGADGVGEVVLLTETAPAYFPRFGFEPITRAEAPEAVKASAEFKGACCASAVAMRLRLANP